jgi:HEAT repeat protein
MDPNPEIAHRAKTCIQAIERGSGVDIPLAVARVLVRRRPPGAVEALLRHLPGAAEVVEEEIYYSLNTLATQESEAATVFQKALTDPEPERRAVAACLLGRIGDARQRAAVRKLLADTDPLVCLRSAQGLLAAKDKAGLPVLVALLSEPSVYLSWQAGELLHWVAGDDAPEPVIGAGGADARQRCRTAWEQWWRQQGRQVDLTQLDQDYRRPGLFLLCTKKNFEKQGGRILLYGCDGKPRWPLGNLWSPCSAQLLPGNRVLIGDSGPDLRGSMDFRVTERDLEGKIHRQRLSFPGLARRLPNGNWFITARGRIRELTPEGKEIYSYDFNYVPRLHFIERLENGHVLVVSSQTVDRSGRGRVQLEEFEPNNWKPVKRVQVLELLYGCRGVAALPDGRYLVADHDDIREVDGAGKTAWQCPLSLLNVSRLRNGNILGTSGNSVVEINRAGKRVGEAFLQDDPVSLRVCLGLVRFGFDSTRLAHLDLNSVSYRIQALRSKDVNVRREAVLALARLGPHAEAAIPVLVATLGDEDERVRHFTVNALVKIGPAAVPAVTKALHATNALVRKLAAQVLWIFGPRAKAAVPDLLELLKDASPDVRGSAVGALGVMGGDATAIVPALLRMVAVHGHLVS